MALLVRLLFAALLATPAYAGTSDGDARAKERATLEGFAAKNPDCIEWSDGCAVCARQDASAFHCSLPGIACQPQELACRPHATPVDPPKEPTPPKETLPPKETTPPKP